MRSLTLSAKEIRKAVIETVSGNGGHLASNLGVVELTVALMLAFDPPKDSIVWDVGHQSYPYKLLTGRFDRFSTMRQVGGLAGFPCREEKAPMMCLPAVTAALLFQLPGSF